MFKKFFYLFLFSSFISKAQNIFDLEAIQICESYETVDVQVKPLGLEFVEFSVNNFDTVPAVTDDTHSGAIDIGFNFDFYGNSYTQTVISSNGYLSFNLANASTGSQWSINSDIPNTANTDAQNSIMCPYTDSEPGPISELIYGTAGVAPNRVFIVIWSNYDMYGGGCNAECFSSGVVLIEGSNKIMTTITNYNSCPAWNDGAGVHGLYENATSAYIVDDPITGMPRNFSNPWSTTQETVVFTPSTGPGGVTYSHVFNPLFTNFSQPLWYDTLGNLVAEGFNIQYTGPHLDDLPSYVTVKSVQCGDSVEVDLPVELGCPGFGYEAKGESCEGFNDGKVNIFVADECGFRVDEWHFNIVDINGNLHQSVVDSVFPISFTNLERGLYYVQYSSPDRPRCIDTIEVYVPYEFQKPLVHADLIDPLCNGESNGIIKFSPHGGYNTDWTVSVYDENGALHSTYNSNTVPINLVGLKAGDYDVVVVSPSACEDTISYTLEDPDPFVFTKEEFDHNNCGTFSGFIDFDVSGGKYPYTFTINGNTVIDLQDDVMPADHYTIEATDANGCTITRDIDIYDKALPVVDFDMPVEVNLADANVTFTDLSTANPYSSITNWLWEFGDTDVSYEQNPTHQYTQIGVYQVYLFATDADGCQDFKVKTLNVVSPQFALPTIFTPNGDGNNEIFRPVIGRISDEDYNITISDRWGRIVYTSTNIFEGWDGRDKKGNIMDGSYIWIAEYKDVYDHKHKQNGIVQLVR